MYVLTAHNTFVGYDDDRRLIQLSDIDRSERFLVFDGSWQDAAPEWPLTGCRIVFNEDSVSFVPPNSGFFVCAEEDRRGISLRLSDSRDSGMFFLVPGPEDGSKELDRFPGRLSAYVWYGDALQKHGMLEEAERIFHLCIERFPDQLSGYEKHAQIASRMSRHDKALERYKLARDRFPGNIHACLWYGNTLLNLNRLDAAETVFLEVLEKFPTQPQGYERLAHVSLRRQRFAQAQEQYLALQVRFPGSMDACTGLGNALLEQGRFEEAEAAFKQCMERFPDHVQGYERHAHAAKRRGEREQALERYRLIRERFPGSFEPAIWYGDALLEQNLLDEAQSVFSDVLEKFPACPQGYERLARISVLSRRFDQAHERYRAFRERFPENMGASVGLGNALLALGRLDEAESVFTQCMEAFPEHVQGYERHAHAAVRKNLPEQALARYKRALDRFPGVLSTHICYGNTLLNLDRLDEAEAAFTTARQRFPSHPHGYERLAHVYMRMKRIVEAQEQYRLLLELFPENIDAYAGLGNALLELDKLDEAERIFRQCRERFPGHVQGYERCAHVEALKGETGSLLARYAEMRERFPGSRHGYTGAAAILELSDLKQAEEFAREAMEKAPEDIQSYFAYADILVRQERLGDAEAFLGDVLKRFPANGACLGRIVNVRRRAGKDVPPEMLQQGAGLNSVHAALYLVSHSSGSPDARETLLAQHAFPPELQNIVAGFLDRKFACLNVLRQHRVDVVSLGYACYLVNFFSRWGMKHISELRAKRMPFCMAAHRDTDVVLDVLRASFDGYASPEYVGEHRVVGVGACCYRSYRYGVVFNHDLVAHYRNKEHFLEVLRQRVDDYLEATRSDASLFVHYTEKQFSESQLSDFVRYQEDSVSSEACILLVEDSDAGLERLSGKCYKVGAPLHGFQGSRVPAWVCSAEGLAYESVVADAIVALVQKHYKKIEGCAGGADDKGQVLSVHHDELFADVQMQTFVEAARSMLSGGDDVGSIVMNCNPFTNGHRHLVEYAASQVGELVVFVVEEDKSFFKFKDRIELVRQGVAHLGNVVVVPSGKFIISTATFPSYFFKDNPGSGAVDATRDIQFFGRYIAPALNIRVRFLGAEPYCSVTRAYNRQLHEILPKHGVQVKEIDRKERDGVAISASLVRKYLQAKEFDKIREIVPGTTYAFLESNFR